MEEETGTENNVDTSVSDRVLTAMCTSVLSIYKHILNETEIEILHSILDLDSDSRRVLYAM